LIQLLQNEIKNDCRRRFDPKIERSDAHEKSGSRKKNGGHLKPAARIHRPWLAANSACRHCRNVIPAMQRALWFDG
jgi:hypothetical protein